MATENPTEVQIALPLPVDVVASLALAMSQIYPSSRISSEHSRSGHMTILVDAAERTDQTTEPMSQEQLAAVKVFKDPYTESATLESLGEENGDLTATFGVPEGVSKIMAEFCVDLLSTPLAKNYAQLQVRDADGQDYFLIACRSKEQSPYDLHQAAIAKLAELKGELLTLDQETLKSSPALLEFLNS